MHKESDCHKDYVNQLSPPDKNFYVNESLGETVIWEKARNRKIFLTIPRKMQLLSRPGLFFQRNNNEENFKQLMKSSAKIDHRITFWMAKKRETHLHCKKMQP